MDYPEAAKRRAKRAKGAAREIASTSAALRNFVRRGGGQSGLSQIDIRVTENPDEPGVAQCIVSIESPTQAEVEQHAAELEDQGCYCQSTGEWSIECDCSEVH
jgi:hypothetical protein